MKLTKRPAYAAHVPIRIAMYRRETSCYSAQEELGRETLCRSAQEELCGEILCQSVQEEPCEMQAVDAAGEYMLVAVYQEEDSNLAQFDRMMADAARNCFDYILAESVSSFGGSTGAALSAIRTLGVNHIGVMFSRENIDTFSEEDQKLLDVIAAFEEKKHREHAQAIHRAIRKNFASGKPRANLNRMLGYDFAEDGRTWIINEEQAGTVRYIFNSFVEGMSANQIARNLNKAGVETVAGSVWRADTVIGVLRNEKYAGDVEMQKTVSASSYMPVANTGQAPKYYQTNHHAAIIDRDLWDRVQAMVRNFGPRNPQIKTRKSGTVFGRLTCGYCGGSLQRFGYSAVIERYSDARSLAAEGVTGEEAKSFSEQYAISYSVWRCENKYKGHEGKSGRLSQSELAASEGCRDSRILHETALEQSFMEMLYRMKYDYQKKGEKCTFACDFRKAYSDVYESLGGTGSHFLQIDALEERIGTLTGQLAAVRSRLEKISPDKMSQPAREEASKGRSPLAGENTTPSASKEILPLAGENVSFSGPKGRSPLSAESASPPASKGTSPLTAENTSPSASESQSETVPASVASVYAKLMRDINTKIAECEEEKKKLTEELTVTLTMKQNYDFFVRCLLALPDQNKAGRRLNINGIHVQGSLFADYDGKGKEEERKQYLEGSLNPEDYLADAPDFLPFDKSMFLTFFSRGVVRKDVVEYTTNFGVRVECPGCGRNLNSFLGFRKVTEDGNLEMITENWQVNGRQIQYRRKRKSGTR